MSDNLKSQKIAIIAGGGPAGLTAAYELLTKTDIVPIVFELDDQVGGISRTIDYKGNKIDIGGHRFFSKSDKVVAWWKEMLPLQGVSGGGSIYTHYQGKSHSVDIDQNGPDPDKSDKVMLIRSRKSRIFFLRKFYEYPIKLNFHTLSSLGFVKSLRIATSFFISRLKPIKPESSLRDFIINRFGEELYLTFFRSYTEKVWGVPCGQIKAEWGAQRIKSLSLSKAIWQQFRGLISKDPTLTQKNVPTSLIEKFMYPKFGPGQLWQEVARQVQSKGGKILLHKKISGIQCDHKKVLSVEVCDLATGEKQWVDCDYFFSTMPVKELITCFGQAVPVSVQHVAQGLIYRDFITVGLLLRKMSIVDKSGENFFPSDNWIYIQERDVKVGRLQIFNNWSPYLVKDKNTVWVGLEYFCNQGDELWESSDEVLKQLGVSELVKMNMISKEDVLDMTVVRMLKTYPAYFGTYDRFEEIKRFTDSFENLFLIGRNGMHRYNNQDHSMLTAMTAVENIISGNKDKSNIWAVNTGDDYHEEK